MTETRGHVRNGHEEVKTPPHDYHYERAVIGAVLATNRVLPDISEILVAEDFYSETHRIIYRAMMRLYSKDEPIDQLTLMNELKQMKELDRIGGRPYIFQIVDSVPTASNATRYAELVKQKSIIRQVIDVGSRITEDAFREPDDAIELLNSAESLVYGISHGMERGRGVLRDMTELGPQVMEQLQKRYEAGGGLTGVPTGFTEIDRLTGGLQDSDLIVLAARPAMGKTSLALDIVKNAAKKDVDCAIFSYEMDDRSLTERMLSSESRIELTNLRRGIIEDHQWSRIMKDMSALSELPVHVTDDATITVSGMRSKLRRLQQKLERQDRKLGLVMIDYLQLMLNEKGSENRQNEIARISRDLKLLAKDLDVPVLAIAQLSRGVEHRGDKKPLLSDLRDSGAIEQDSDLVMMIYREEYYTEEKDLDDDIRGIADVLIRKNRNGPTGEIKLSWQEDYATFGNLETRKITEL